MVDRGNFTQQEIRFLDESIVIQSKLEARSLPADFQPDNWSVICGRGKECYTHIGNRRLRVLVDANLDRYAETKSKIQKTLIVSSIIDSVREAAVGGFVKRDAVLGWVEVGDDAAREKVGQLLREAMTRRNPAKLEARKERRRARAKRNTSVLSKDASATTQSTLETATITTATIEEDNSRPPSDHDTLKTDPSVVSVDDSTDLLEPLPIESDINPITFVFDIQL